MDRSTISIVWVWAVFITMIDFEHQHGLQIVSTFARISIILLMIFTSIGLLYSDFIYNGNSFSYTNESKPYINIIYIIFIISGITVSSAFGNSVKSLCTLGW